MSVKPETILEQMRTARTDREKRAKEDGRRRRLSRREHCLEYLGNANQSFSEFQEALIGLMPADNEAVNALVNAINDFDRAILRATELVPSEKELIASE